MLTNLYPSLNRKIVLITGGASGIGACLVKAFARQCAVVAFVDIQDSSAKGLVDECESSGVGVVPRYYRCDLTDIPMLKNVFNRIQQDLGFVNVLINNAANDERHDFRDLSLEYWNERIAVNLRHHFFASQAVYDGMKALGGGVIVNLGSICWSSKQSDMPVYTCSKAAIEGLTRGLARDMGADNIRVNTVVPGWVMTERQMEYFVDKDAEDIALKAQCLKHKVEPEDIAAMVLFLASDDSRLCTSQHFIVDGGWV